MVKVLKKVVLVWSLIPFALNAKAAEDHTGFSRIIADNAALTYHDHTFSGKLGESLVFGEAQCQDAFATLTIRNSGKTYQIKLQKNTRGVLSGVLEHARGHLSVELASIDQDRSTITLQVNDKPLEVQISADGIEDSHFVNPAYSFSHNGQSYSYKIEKGSACWGQSIKLSLMFALASLIP